MSEPIEVWGGIECTVNRVGETWHDQISLSGHAERAVADIESFARLGIRTLRYPVLWERIAPGDLRNADWAQTDLALSKMRQLGITPIVGLIHHGSGPRYTSLLDPEFSRKLAEFATAVAERYPWADMYTPINEPLTTARFATLYGHWYPHARDDRSFARAVINQCHAIRAAMEAIRAVNSRASLVQTEDLGKTYSTAPIDYQANFDNHRRWLTFDILSGRLDEWHPLWWYLLESGIARHELESFLARPCVPHIIGINYYVTSERFLDHRVDLYPKDHCGGNGRHTYADVEAVRTLEDGITGHIGALREAWNRYGLPLAITEVHLGCTREEQLRWLGEAWQAARQARTESVDVRAITVWSLLGSYGWCSLLTGNFDSYEAGAFDLRSPRPRPTAVANMLRGLATTGDFDHPVLDSTGWWRRPSRLMRPSYQTRIGRVAPLTRGGRPILITGCDGTLGRAFQRIANERGLAVHAAARAELDICQPRDMRRVLGDIKPWAVVNAAGYVRVDDAETECDRCLQVNTDGASLLARQCERRGIQFVAFSSDLVFDGQKRAPYVETDSISPLNVYGASKARLEHALRDLSNSLVIRTSAFFGPWDRHNFLAVMLDRLKRQQPVLAANDAVVSPTYVPDLVHTTLDLMIDGERGIWHLANADALTWYEFAVAAAERAELDARLIEGRAMGELGHRATRPVYSALQSERAALMPSLDDAMDRWLGAIRTADVSPQVLETSSSV